jgi:hypothetical protein
MNKIVVETIPVTRLNEKMQFQIAIPENATVLTGVDVCANKNYALIPGFAKVTHRGIGIIRLFIAGRDDCFFSQMLHAEYAIPRHEQIGANYLKPQLWTEAARPYELFPAMQLAQGTIICGYYEDLLGLLPVYATDYSIVITLHFETSHP